VHKDNVDDLDFDPSGARLATVASTPQAIIWRCVDGMKDQTISWYLLVSLLI
jgi:hypothetical protein